jgi:hypothetical protein
LGPICSSIQLLDAGGVGHPAGFDLQLGHPSVVASEKCQEVPCEAIPVDLGQGADDAEVERDVAVEVVARLADQDVARGHVGMEETVPEHLRNNGISTPSHDSFFRSMPALAIRSMRPIGMP